MYNYIINGIKSNLTGDKAQDKAYLIAQIKKFANTENGPEIVREISRLMWDCLTDEEKEEFSRVSASENPVKKAFDEAVYHMQNNKRDVALHSLDLFFKSYSFGFHDDNVNEYHSFSNPIEEILFNQYFKTDKQIRLIPDYNLYVEICHLYGFLLIEFGRFDDAEKVLDYAIKLNPVFVLTIFERAEIFKYKKDFDSFFKYSTDALKYSYSSSNLARAYRNLGFYYIEKEEFELATALFNYSLSYEYSPNAFSELEYIKSLGVKNTISEDKILTLLEKNNIQTGPNPIIFNILTQLIIQEGLNKNVSNQLFLYQIYYDLTKDEEILEKINELQQKV